MAFPTTHWTQLADATLSGDTTGRAAMEQLCQDYWPPVQGMVKAWWPAAGEAGDVTQDFFLHLLEKGALRRVDRERGKFRTFLLGALRRFLSTRLSRERAEKRGGGQALVELEEWMAGEENDDPDFDRAWAISLLQKSLRRLEAEQEGPEFETLRHFLPGAGEAQAYETAADVLGWPLGTLKSAVNRLRLRLREIIRLEVARTVASPHEIDEEMSYLHRMLRG